MTLLQLQAASPDSVGSTAGDSSPAGVNAGAPAGAPDQAAKLRDLVRQHEAALRQTPAVPVPRPVEPVRSRPMAAQPALPQPVPQQVPQPALQQFKPAPRPLGRRAKTIAITSGKGGVGKTNLSVNLAARFAQAGKATVLLDADMGLANADVLCGLELRHNLAHVIARRMQLVDVIAEAPGGFRLIGGASGLSTMADLPAAEHKRLLSSLADLERSCDLILIDTGAGISQNVLSFTRAADQVLVVTTPEPTAIADAYATIKVICRERAGGDRRPISLVVNQVKSATEARRVFERVAKVVHDFLGVDLGDAGFLPADPAVGKAVRKRSPFLLSYPRCAASVCITRLAMRLEAGVASAPQARAASIDHGFFGMIARALRARIEPEIA